MLRCLNIAVSNAACEKKGQTAKTGGKQLSIDEFLAIFTEFANQPASTWGVLEDFMECLKLYDKEQNGKLQLGELSTIIVNMAEKLTKAQVDEVLESTKTKDDEGKRQKDPPSGPPGGGGEQEQKQKASLNTAAY